MTDFPKLPNKPECLGFRKTIVLNLTEHGLLKLITADILNQLHEGHEPDWETIRVIQSIVDKLNAPTPQPHWYGDPQD